MIKCIDGKKHKWKDGWICDVCGLKKADYEDNKKIIELTATLMMLANIDVMHVKKREFSGVWYEAVIPIGNDNVAYLTIDSDGMDALKKIV